MQLVALGANVSSGGCALDQTIGSAVKAMAGAGLPIRAVSRFFRTPCFPAGAGPDYVNAAILLRDHRPAHEILRVLHRIEADFGRARIQRWGSRTLDLDLIACGHEVLPNEATFRHWLSLDPELQAKAAPDQLVLPHPRLQDRAFVLVPLSDIAPDWVHPVLGKTVRAMLEALPEAERAEVVSL